MHPLFYWHKLKEYMSDNTDSASGDPSVDIEALATAFIQKIDKKTDGASGEAAIQAVGQLLKENRKHRQNIRDLKNQVSELKQQVPDEGTAVVPKADYDALTALKEEDESAEQFAKRVKRGMEAVAEVETLKREGALREVAEHVGYNYSVLRDRSQGLAVALEGEGEERAAVVEVDGKKVPLTEYAEEHWSDYMPALVKEASDQPPRRASFPRQPSGNPPKHSIAKPASEVKKEKDRDKRYVAI